MRGQLVLQQRQASSGAPVHGGNLVFATPQDAQSMNNTTVFDNNSIWIFEQIFQPLYTVTNNGKGVMPWLATSYTMSADKKTYTFTLRQGGEVLQRQADDLGGREVLHRPEPQGRRRAGPTSTRPSTPSTTRRPSTVVINLKFPWAPLLADLSLFANGIVPNNYGGETETAVLPAPDRHRPVQVGLLAQGPGAQAGPQPVLLAAGQALPEQRDLDRRAQRQHPASCSSRAARRRSTSSRPGPRCRP